MGLNKIIKNILMLFPCFGKKALARIGLLLTIVSFFVVIICIIDESISNTSNFLDPTVQYNQSSAPYVAYGEAPSGNINDLNVLGEGLTYDVSESQDGDQYRVDVWHNSSQVSSGTLTFINTTINFTSTVAATYSLQIFNWNAGEWNQTDCQTVNLAANEVTMLWCNKTENLANYVSSDNAVRIRINNTNHSIQGTLKEDYVQYYLGYFSGYLEVQLIEPDPTKTTYIAQNNTLLINATIICRDGPCGNIYGIARYNASSVNLDTEINTTQGDRPFYVQESPALAMKSCPTNPLYANEFCNLTWVINATGYTDTIWKIGILSNSSFPETQQNHTRNATIYIMSCTEDIGLAWTSIDFGSLSPNTNYNNATYNNQNLYNITNKGNCPLNLWIKGVDLQNVTYSSTIAVGNLSWSNTTNSYTTSSSMTYSYVSLNKSLPQNQNLTTYYWLSVPPVDAGYYIGSVYICGNYSSIC